MPYDAQVCRIVKHGSEFLPSSVQPAADVNKLPPSPSSTSWLTAGLAICHAVVRYCLNIVPMERSNASP